jgi:hypothetical protein
MFKVPHNTDKLFNIGKYVMQVLHERHLSVPRFAKLGGFKPKWVYNLLQRTDWPISYIVQFSELLKDDLTRFYRPGFVPEPVPKPELDKAKLEIQQLQQQLQEQNAQIAELEKANLLLTTENKVMREVLEGRK